MFEDANGTMIPDSTMLREIHHEFHYGEGDVVSDLFDDEWDGITGPVNEALCLEAIDDDPIVNALLAAENL